MHKLLLSAADCLIFSASVFPLPLSSYAKSKGESVNSFVIRSVKEVMGKKVGQSTLKNRETPWNSKGFRVCRDYSSSIREMWLSIYLVV